MAAFFVCTCWLKARTDAAFRVAPIILGKQWVFGISPSETNKLKTVAYPPLPILCPSGVRGCSGTC